MQVDLGFVISVISGPCILSLLVSQYISPTLCLWPKVKIPARQIRLEIILGYLQDYKLKVEG